jgi:molybdopterin-containing oxidoreductase family iron-sulfur binding subunit
MVKPPATIPYDVTRRGFLRALGLAGAGAAVGGLVPDEEAAAATETKTEPEHQWAFVVDLRRCDGCEKCTKACQDTHYLAKDQKWINVYKITDTTGQTHFMPRLCMHCENPPCLRVCPTGATFKNDEGVVLVNQNTCIGCRTCMAACPYEARYFNWQEPPPAPALLQQSMPEFPVPQKKGTVGKCILCVHNTEMGKLPACVEACTMGALWIGDLKTDVATNGSQTVKLSKFLRENDAVRFREELGTRPRLWYIPGHGQKLDF